MYKLLMVLGTALMLFGCERGVVTKSDDCIQTDKVKFEVVAIYSNHNGTGQWVEEIRDLGSGVHYYRFYERSGGIGVAEVYNQDGTLKITGVK